MKYILFSFNGYSFPIAKQLIDEGNDVIVAQIQDSKELKVDGYQGREESPELKKRRLSLYDGIFKKYPADFILKSMEEVENKNDYFVIVDHNYLNLFGEKILKMGYTGWIPNEEDFKREKDRPKAQEFVKKYYKKRLASC